MKVRVEVEMLPMVVVLFLALGLNHGLVIDKCRLGEELNSTLSANLSDHFTNLVAKIVCHAELSSHFNTSAINYVTGPNVHSFIRGHHGRPKGKSSSEESSEEDIDSSSGAERNRRSVSKSSSEESREVNVQVPKQGFNSSTINPVIHPQGNNSFSGKSQKARKGRSAKSSSEESSEEKVQVPKQGFNSSTINPVTHPQGNNSFSGKSLRKGRSAESSREESSEEKVHVPKQGFNSSTINPVTHSNSFSGKSRRARKGRSAESSREESSKENVQVPKQGFNSSTINPVTHPQANNSFSGKSLRKGRSAESSSRESDERNVWTLYGLFQLPDRIACSSGFEPSLNLCSMACDSLIDDDIRDDITCVETILNKMLSAENSHEPSKALFNKLHETFFQKECNNAEDFKYFSTCKNRQQG